MIQARQLAAETVKSQKTKAKLTNVRKIKHEKFRL